MIKNLENNLKYKFNNINLLNQALIHSSYHSNSLKPNNERMEFLGDKVLANCMADIIYNQFPNHQEDRLSQMFSYLTSQDSLNNIANQLQIAKYLKHNSNIHSKILSSAVEAIIAAIYLDSNLDNIKQCILQLWQNEIKNIDTIKAYDVFNPKSYVQNWVQQQLLPLPVYKDLEKQGSDHNPTFVVELQIKDFTPILGTGSNKKLAQKDAATKFIKLYIK